MRWWREWIAARRYVADLRMALAERDAAVRVANAKVRMMQAVNDGIGSLLLSTQRDCIEERKRVAVLEREVRRLWAKYETAADADASPMKDYEFQTDDSYFEEDAA